jgi:hypothetical protein
VVTAEDATTDACAGVTGGVSTTGAAAAGAGSVATLLTVLTATTGPLAAGAATAGAGFDTVTEIFWERTKPTTAAPATIATAHAAAARRIIDLHSTER